MKSVVQAVLEFLKAQQKAEETGEKQFKCPLCGGDAWWQRSSYNGHLHCGCEDCRFLMME